MEDLLNAILAAIEKNNKLMERVIKELDDIERYVKSIKSSMR